MTVLDGFYFGIGVIGASLSFLVCVIVGFVIAWIIKGFVEGLVIGWNRGKLLRSIKSKELRRDEIENELKRRTDEIRSQ